MIISSEEKFDGVINITSTGIKASIEYLGRCGANGSMELTKEVIEQLISRLQEVLLDIDLYQEWLEERTKLIGAVEEQYKLEHSGPFKIGHFAEWKKINYPELGDFATYKKNKIGKRQT